MERRRVLELEEFGALYNVYMNWIMCKCYEFFGKQKQRSRSGGNWVSGNGAGGTLGKGSSHMSR